jgi:hypothetical protein
MFTFSHPFLSAVKIPMHTVPKVMDALLQIESEKSSYSEGHPTQIADTPITVRVVNGVLHVSIATGKSGYYPYEPLLDEIMKKTVEINELINK